MKIKIKKNLEEALSTAGSKGAGEREVSGHKEFAGMRKRGLEQGLANFKENIRGKKMKIKMMQLQKFIKC